MAESDAPNESTGIEVRKFNPGTLQSDRQVVDQFVVRRHELDIVLEIVRGNIRSASCQHVLVVGPRGRGKTMLLARAEAELRTDKELSERLLPVRFMEESHEIATVADFWLETLFHLSRVIAAAHPGLAAELRATHASLCERWRERALHDNARAAVLDAADRLGRKLVLMVENLQALCNNVDDDFGWQLRAALQSEPQIMLLGSATSRFQALDDAEQPFFELFRIVELKPLATDDCRRLWQAVSGNSVSGREIRPLEILTGGSPRLLVIVAGFARHRSLRRLMEELVTLVDQHTEYFRGHLEVLPKTERRVYVAVIDLWRPSSTGEIAARARMDVRVVSTMLGRLVDRGAVRSEPGQSGGRRLYAAAEPLYSIYYKLRRERDEAAVVENLILFMVAFYDPFVLYRFFDRLWSEAKDSPALQGGIERALDNPDSQALVAEAMVLQAEAEREVGRLGPSVFLLDGLVTRFGDCDAPGVQHAVVRALVMKADVLRTQGKHGETTITVYDEAIERGRDLQVEKVGDLLASASLNRAFCRGHLGDFEGEIASYQELIDVLGDDDGHREELALAAGLRNLRQAEMGRTEEALQGCMDLEKSLGSLDGGGRAWTMWLGLCARAMVLAVQHDASAVGAFRSAYTGLPTGGSQFATGSMIRLVLNLIAVGASESVLLEVLSSDNSKSRALAPLIAALRERGGEVVRGPTEVLEVAADVRKRIEEKAAKGILTAF